MKPINIALMTAQVTGVALQVNQVRQDPAVVKAGKQAWSDIQVAFDSTTTFLGELRSAWRRSSSRQEDTPGSSAFAF